MVVHEIVGPQGLARQLSAITRKDRVEYRGAIGLGFLDDRQEHARAILDPTRLRDNAGLSKDLILYLARHECGTKFCRETGIAYARRLRGHANISTTQRYMHLDERELADAQDLIT